MTQEMLSLEDDWPEPDNLGFKLNRLFERVFRQQPLGTNLAMTLIEAYKHYDGTAWHWRDWLSDNIAFAKRKEMPDSVRLYEHLSLDYLHRLERSFPRGSAGRKFAQTLLINAGYKKPKDPFSMKWFRGEEIAGVVLESLPALPPTADFSHLFKWLLYGGRFVHLDKKRIASIFQSYRNVGEPVGKELRKNIFPLLLDLSVRKGMLDRYQNDLARLCEPEEPETQHAQQAGKTLPSQAAQERFNAVRQLIAELIVDAEPGTPSTVAHEMLDKEYTAASTWVAKASLEELVRYRAAFRSVKAGGFTGVGSSILFESRKNGLVSPYFAITASTCFSSAKPVLSYLRLRERTGSLEERIVADVTAGFLDNLIGRKEDATIDTAAASTNLKAIMAYDLPEEVDGRDLARLLLMPNSELQQGLVSAMKIKAEDKEAAILLIKGLGTIYALFGDKTSAVLNYFESEHRRDHLRKINNFYHEDYVAKELSGVRIDSFGKRQGERLVKLADCLSTIAELTDAAPTITMLDLKQSYDNALSARRSVVESLGLTDSEDTYRFIPFIKTRDPIVLTALRQGIPKAGPRQQYQLETGGHVIDALKEEVAGYAQMAGIRAPPLKSQDLQGIKTMTAQVISELSRKKDVEQTVVAEVKPNLDRIMTLATNGGGTYELVVDPNDVRSQMEALQNVQSCLSPQGIMFEYTLEYLNNSNAFWATVRGSQGVVGRVTVLRGVDKKGAPALARISKVYALVPLSEASIDNALRAYANTIGARYLTEGTLTVPGLTKAYDDFAKGNANGLVVVSRKS